ncbi:MAG TPA: aconitase/3-isopropylmalate dehydratase large subunit family protein [Stellaceae bacterium]|nr:aconitase/3-isopropylmalate dehydratase large subunit family protein [Stellaceae bacterium]
MGMNIAEKILARAAGAASVAPGEIAVVEVGTSVLTDMNFLPASWREILKVPDPGKVAIVLDHFVPANDAQSAAAHTTARRFAERFGIKRFHDVGRDQGISHVVVADEAYALPGTVLVNADSHTCGGGALNCAARGVGLPEMLFAVTTGKSWFRVGETIRYDFEGRLRPGVSAKDVFLHIAGTYGAHVNQNVEFGGPGMAGLSLNARRTLAIMGTELSAEFVIFEPDDRLLDYVRERNPAPFTPQWPDADARYKERRTLALDRIEPLVALPDAVVNSSVPVAAVAGQRIDQAFIGSCANGTLDDLEAAAKIVAGRRVASGVRFIVTPGSQAIYRAALAAGYVATLTEAGAVVTAATCGACVGGHMGVLGPGEICITASTRNFKGRMGDPSARIYMASPATVAASALAGRIAGAADYFAGAPA